MARSMSSTARPLGSATTTLTLTLERPSQSPSPQGETLVLKLNRKKKKVTWKEGTVDNEFLQKKSSKKCCIFHKQKPFDEDDSDDDDDRRIDGPDGSEKAVHGHDHGCCSENSGEASTSGCC